MLATLPMRSARVRKDIIINYTTAGESTSRHAILLIHGYPQTLYSMRHLLKGFASLGYFAVAADYRGAGGSSMSKDGYDKVTMGTDLHLLMTETLKRDKYILLGHDIGSMVATAQALTHREHIEALIMMECPQPGTSQYHTSVTDRDFTMDFSFHFFFHNAKDLPEQLTYGREGIYLHHFFDRLAYNTHFASSEEKQNYIDAFSRAGRMTAGFELYRAFRKDDDDVKSILSGKGKLTCPVLATGGSESLLTKFAEGMAKEVAENVTFVEIKESGHWVPEENPTDLLNSTARFLSKCFETMPSV